MSMVKPHGLDVKVHWPTCEKGPDSVSVLSSLRIIGCRISCSVLVNILKIIINNIRVNISSMRIIGCRISCSVLVNILQIIIK
jgi:hypothetical protein